MSPPCPCIQRYPSFITIAPRTPAFNFHSSSPFRKQKTNQTFFFPPNLLWHPKRWQLSLSPSIELTHTIQRIPSASVPPICQLLTENADFTVVGILGPPGIGKSTLMNALYGSESQPPAEGALPRRTSKFRPFRSTPAGSCLPGAPLLLCQVAPSRPSWSKLSSLRGLAARASS